MEMGVFGNMTLDLLLTLTGLLGGMMAASLYLLFVRPYLKRRAVMRRLQWHRDRDKPYRIDLQDL